jgi:amidohydrolase
VTRIFVEGDLSYLESFRRELHQHPELMYEEHWTAQRIREELDKTGVAYVGGLAGGTGTIAHLPATKTGGRTVALRADIDALPIHEETGLPYASQIPGKMHACGHDGHTAVLLGAARALSKVQDRPNDILFLFQPAEEGGAGARRLCEEGALDGRIIGPPVDVVFGHHNNPLIEQGVFTIREGAMMAAADQFVVTIHGKGGHAAMPHLGRDPVVALAHTVSVLQTLASRNASPLDSLVVSVTTLEAGHAHNVIPDSCTFGGTMRTLKPETRELGKARLFETVHGVAAAHGCRAEIDWREGYPVTHNDPWATERWRSVAEGVVGPDRVAHEEHPTMGAEDFSFYGERVPAAFWFAGSRPPGCESAPGLHTPRFDYNDDILSDCVETMCALALAEHSI